jgi:hypothetical protein
VSQFEKDTLMNYIHTNHEKHNSAACTKNTDTGGCFLCEYKNGIIPNCMLEKSVDNSKIVPVTKTPEKSDLIYDHALKFENDVPTSGAMCKIKQGDKITLAI